MGGPTPRGVLSKRLQQEWMEGVQQQEINTGRTVRTTGEYTINTKLQLVQQLTDKGYRKQEARTTGEHTIRTQPDIM